MYGCIWTRQVHGAARRPRCSNSCAATVCSCDGSIVGLGAIRCATTGERLLVPSKSDVPMTRWAAHALYASLMSAGVRIYEYRPRMMHAKTVVVDRHWATLGSANLDYRSFFLNYELLLAMTAPDDCELLSRQFWEDASTSRLILGDGWSRRSWTSRLLEVVGRALRRWL
jgi:cardiolipin synthase